MFFNALSHFQGPQLWVLKLTSALLSLKITVFWLYSLCFGDNFSMDERVMSFSLFWVSMRVVLSLPLFFHYRFALFHFCRMHVRLKYFLFERVKKKNVMNKTIFSLYLDGQKNVEKQEKNRWNKCDSEFEKKKKSEFEKKMEQKWKWRRVWTRFIEWENGKYLRIHSFKRSTVFWTWSGPNFRPFLRGREGQSEAYQSGVKINTKIKMLIC